MYKYLIAVIITLLLINHIGVNGSIINPLRSLPTYNGDIKGQYTGYITVQTKEYFFWFVESSRNPEKDPVIVYLNGGPGCSSMLSALTETGPFTVQKDETKSGKDKYYIVDNKYAWSTTANMMYIESPAGVGFSYNENGNYTTGDTQTAEDNLAVMESFYQLFPAFVSNPLFIGGESYSGHYSIQLALLLATRTSLNLRGVLVGNPSFNFTTDAQYYLPFMAGHGLLSYNDFQNLTNVCNGQFYPASGECQQGINQLSTNFDLINPYNILQACKGMGPSKDGGCFTTAAMLTTSQRDPESIVQQMMDSQVFIPCLDESAITGYLNRDDVQKHLGVSTRNIPTGDWSPCSSVVNYTQYLDNIPQDYQTLLQRGMHILVYSGDLDSCVPYLGTSQCVVELGYPVLNPWKPWTYYDEEGFEQVAGYHVSYDSSSANSSSSLSYATVKGAGHMVPQYKPKEALLMMNNYISLSLSKDNHK